MIKVIKVIIVNNETAMLPREMQRNTKKCREMQRYSENCMRNAEKCREIQRKAEKCRYCRDILMTLMTHGNVTFDIIEPLTFRKYSTCWVLQKFEEPCRILKKIVHACVVNIIHVQALPGSVLYV